MTLNFYFIEADPGPSAEQLTELKNQIINAMSTQKEEILSAIAEERAEVLQKLTELVNAQKKLPEADRLEIISAIKGIITPADSQPVEPPAEPPVTPEPPVEPPTDPVV